VALLLTAVVETVASSLTALGPSKILYLQKSPDAEMARCWKYCQTLKKPDAEKIALIPKNFSALPLDTGDVLSSLFQCLVLSPCKNHQTLKWPDAENIARRWKSQTLKKLPDTEKNKRLRPWDHL
jgi:hypothetical protein